MGSFLGVAHVIGPVIVIFALTMLAPLSLAFFGGDAALYAYDESILIAVAAGGFLWLATRRHKRELQPRDGFLLVSLVWAVLPAFAALPLLIYMPQLSFTDAYFETASALTTTGATVLTGLDTLPPSVNLWRHLLQWLGGMGIIVLAVAILPLLGVGGREMFKAETPGPMKDAKLTPRIAETAKNLWLVYAAITLACIIALKIAGMSWLDAVSHAFSAMSLGGFSTHDASVGFFDSPAIEAVLIVFMTLAGINFATHFLAWRGRSLGAYLRDAEAVAFVLLMVASCIGIGWYLWIMGTYESFWTALRHASFNLISVATDCGYASVDFDKWPIFAPLWMLFLSCVAVSSGSTGGGIKMIRTIVQYKQSQRELVKLLHPAVVNPLKIGGQVIPNNVVFSVQGFIFLYFMSIVILTFVLMASGLDYISAFSAIIACINNMGPGLNQVGPAANYQVLTDFQTWVCSFAMILGRLEVFTLLIIFTPAFWQK
ncbi:MAG: TrkH family potassium uptake protein [Betaproteobacteria bacterium]|nr:TrkH family potassium uptake protein [Betaproteobacteria bacterium]